MVKEEYRFTRQPSPNYPFIQHRDVVDNTAYYYHQFITIIIHAKTEVMLNVNKCCRGSLQEL